MTTINAVEHTATAGCPCRLPLLAQAELDEWDSAITALEAALADAAAARRDLADAEREAGILEARALLPMSAEVGVVRLSSRSPRSAPRRPHA